MLAIARHHHRRRQGAQPLIGMAPGEAGGHLIGRVTRKLPMRYLALWRAQRLAALKRQMKKNASGSSR